MYLNYILCFFYFLLINSLFIFIIDDITHNLRLKSNCETLVHERYMPTVHLHNIYAFYYYYENINCVYCGQLHLIFIQLNAYRRHTILVNDYCLVLHIWTVMQLFTLYSQLKNRDSNCKLMNCVCVMNVTDWGEVLVCEVKHISPLLWWAARCSLVSLMSTCYRVALIRSIGAALWCIQLIMTMALIRRRLLYSYWFLC